MPALGAVELQAVRGAQVQKLYNSMTRARLSEKTVKNVSAVLHKAFSVALKQRIIAANPCDAAELPKAEHREICPLADGEIPQFLAAIDGSPMRNAYALCLFAGLRERECLGLSWKQVDFEKGWITISQQLQREKVKGGKYYIFCKRFKAIAASIGGPHDFVYTFATTALLNGVDVKTVSNMLGHYSTGFTLDTHTYVTAQMQQAAAGKWGGWDEQD